MVKPPSRPGKGPRKGPGVRSTVLTFKERRMRDAIATKKILGAIRGGKMKPLGSKEALLDLFYGPLAFRYRGKVGAEGADRREPTAFEVDPDLAARRSPKAMAELRAEYEIAEEKAAARTAGAKDESGEDE
ncbi:hypothetical protein ACFL5U_00330 [Candidatus Margulisiibacteriota bacterium]